MEINQKIKVVTIISELRMGGAEVLVKEYALLIDESKIDYIVIVDGTRIGSPIEKQLDEANKKVIYLYRNPFFRYSLIKRIIRKTTHRILLYTTLKKIKPDIIHVNLGSYGFWGCNRTADKYARKNRLRIFDTVHNEPIVHLDSPKRGYLLKHKNVRFIALHEEMKREIEEIFSVRNTTVIRNGIDIQRFMSLSKSKEEMRRALGIPEDSFVIGNIGRMVMQKNHHFLIEIFQELLEMKPNAYLLLVGEGDLEDEIRNHLCKLNLEKKATIISNRHDIPEILNAMDVFVFPSQFEGLGIVLIEAQAVGVKCVVSDRIPKEAFVTNKIWELSLDAPLIDWCNAILDSSSANNLCLDNRLEDYDIRKIVKDLEALYLENS
ncbi:MAG: glycosyltransferase [Lachnospiraceae bacterium]|jgi:glycosyltransferase involved in cell wall biosynthesis|nr:glycosyltransferase [Lachnospiraceae bacterium]